LHGAGEAGVTPAEQIVATQRQVKGGSMAEMFANAIGYEEMMGRWSVRLAPLFANFARIADGGRVLDVGCGTGSLVRTVAGMTRRSEIVGIDPVQPFVEYARARLADSRITFDRGNALDLPYPAASFTHTLSLLVLMFIPQPEKAAHEMRRVTRPGGTVAASTWDRDGMEMSAVFWDEAVGVDPDAEARSERPRRLNQPGQLAALWHVTGLQEVEETVLEIGMDFTSFDDYWQPHLKGVGPAGAYVAGLPAEHREALRHALQKRLQGHGPDRAFSLRAKALAVRGVVPKAQ
jgi:SAM-dependent methyltransferase